MIYHKSSGGRGRLASTETYNDPAAPGAGGLSLRRVVDEFTYDGIRRVREIRTVQAFNESTNAWVVETPTKLLREYVWGPGDGHAGVDELIAQFGGATDVDDETKPNARWRPWFTLQDGGGDIVAVVDSGLVPQSGLGGGGGGSSQPASVAAQFVYNAYGEVIAAEHLSPHPLLHAGHKGLFFDSLKDDATSGYGGQFGEVIDWETGDELTTLVANASGLYQMRNRVYSPTLGRFMQRDPNATSMVLIEAPVALGTINRAAVEAISPEAMYGDGCNLSLYLGNNPLQRFDELGLSWAEMAGDAVVAGIRGIRGGLAEMTSQYGANMEADLDWAMDWRQGDEWHSRNSGAWVSESFARGMEEGFRAAFNELSYGLYDYLDYDDGSSDSPTMASAGAARRVPIIESLGAAAGPTKKLNLKQSKALRGQARGMWERVTKSALGANDEIHHRIPLEWAHMMPAHPNRMTNLAKVSKSHHKDISGMWREFKRRYPNPTPSDIYRQARAVDAKFGHLMQYIK